MRMDMSMEIGIHLKRMNSRKKRNENVDSNNFLPSSLLPNIIYLYYRLCIIISSLELVIIRLFRYIQYRQRNHSRYWFSNSIEVALIKKF